MQKLHGYLDKIKHASNRMSKLITDVLDYSRISRVDQFVTRVDLNLVVKEVVREFELAAAEKNAVIEVGELPVVGGVSAQFHQLFRNLIGNALKFTDRPPRISILAEGRHIRIKDNGIGFPQGLAEKIFDIFQRLNSQDVYGGSGIGLALCKKIVENHGGTIKADSAPGKGSTFHIYLPA
jgi:signal transduction histidine kinase